MRYDASSHTHLVTVAALAAAFAVGAHGCAPPKGDAPPPAASSGDGLEATVPAVVPIRNARVPRPGLLTGGQPTEAQIEEAARAGFKTVITLRTPGELTGWGEADAVRGAGMRFEEIPVDGAGGLTMANAERLATLLAEPGVTPAMLHCGSGNRVGALLAVLAHRIEGASVDDAMELGRKAGLTRLEDATRDALEGGK